jgi:glutamine amidotransferase
MIGVIDYGAGNLGNALRALKHLGHAARLLASPCELDGNMSLLILPGVGAFPPAKEALARRGWPRILHDWTDSGKPLLGICLGMQLLYAASLEDGRTEGLGFFHGEVVPLAGLKKSPHMGWNRVNWVRDVQGVTELFPEGLDAYFVHGYAAPVTDISLAETTVDDLCFSSVSMKGNIAGFQFHPERSGTEGLRLLGTFIDRLSEGHP